MSFSKNIKLKNHYIGKDFEPFIIAEVSANHNGSLERMIKIVDAAAEIGAHAIKLQTYTADTMTLNSKDKNFLLKTPDKKWNKMSYYELYQKASTPWSWHKEIFKRCREKGIICFSTPFDKSAVDFLEELNTPAYKIASFENVDTKLIEYIASKKKPIIMSTGMATINELYESVKIIENAGCKDLILLKCTSTYPANAANCNISTIPHMQDLFNIQVGLSDHTLGTGVALASIAFGATVIEKHFTLLRDDGGFDAEFSLEKNEMKNLIVESKRAWKSLGCIFYGAFEDEKKSLESRRSLYITEDMNSGDVFSELNLKSIRPGFGLSVKYYDIIIGKKINRNINKNTPLNWNMIG